MIGPDDIAHRLEEGEEWLKVGHHGAAEACFRKCLGIGNELTTRLAIGLAEAILGQEPDRERAREAYNLLVGAFFREEVSLSPALRCRFLDLLCTSAQIEELDLELADLILGRDPVRLTPGAAPSMLKAFYFAGACDGLTPGERAVTARRYLEGRLRSKTTLVAEAYTLQFAKAYSSNTPLQDLAGDNAVGGGYFLALGGYGCVIDPGHNFLENFYKLPRTLADIDCIIVTHFHDDHYANLPALLSLLYQRWKRNGRQVRLLLDTQTHAVFQPMINPNSPESVASKDSDVLDPASARQFALPGDVVLRPLPTQHEVFNRHTGVGLHFEIPPRNMHLVITGDTGWTTDLARVYGQFRNLGVTLVAHVSSARPEEELVGTLTTSRDMFYGQHLCIHGLCKLIEVVRPHRLILSEIGEELKEVTGDLQRMIHRYYREDMPIGMGNSMAGTYYL